MQAETDRYRPTDMHTQTETDRYQLHLNENPDDEIRGVRHYTSSDSG